jgi:predicted nuclease with RNAse H fold
MNIESITVAGIDIGGDKKGCHLVVIRGNEVLCNIKSNEPMHLAQKCIEFDALIVGVDSPCGWSTSGGSRPAERELAKNRIFSFSTPTRERAQANTSGFYGWMFNGERVYQALASTYPLLTEKRYLNGKVSFETFPHAISCAMLGTNVASAKLKRLQRRQLLEAAGISTQSLRSIDAVDAGLCALAAKYLLQGETYSYGDLADGYIVVPKIHRQGE